MTQFRLDFCALQAAILGALLTLSGCQSARTLLGTQPVLGSTEDQAENDHAGNRTPSDDSRSKAESAIAASNHASTAAPANDFGARLAEDRWVRTIGPTLTSTKGFTFRWRHPLVEPAQWQTPQRTTELKQALTSDNPQVRGNAAIFAARAGLEMQGDSSSYRLAEIAADPSRKLPQRCAAAESLALVREPDTATSIQRSIDALGDPSGPAASDYVVDLHIDLLRALPWHVAPSAEPRFAAALSSRSADVRAIAVEAWLRNTSDELPVAVIDLRQDSDPRVRSMVIGVLAAHQHPDAQDFISQAVDDQDFTVRIAAITALGRLGGEQARERLSQLKQNPSEVARSAVITALAAAGADEEAVSAAVDKSAKVRQAVAQVLATAPETSAAIKQETIALAYQLLHDASAEVQLKAVDSLQSWPLEYSGPILLKALEQPAYLTRQAAAKQLAQKWPPAEDFPADGTAEARETAIRGLKQKWIAQFGPLDQQLATAGKARLKQEVSQRLKVDPEKLATVAAQLSILADRTATDASRQQALAQLALLDEGLLPVLEALAAEGHTSWPSELYTTVLPRLSPVFANLDRLTSADATVRRTAVVAVANELSGRPLSALELQRLSELMTSEADPVVWQQVLRTTHSDAREAAERLAYLAIGHTSADVRRLACEYLIEHPAPRHAVVLVPMLDDPNSSVLIAAVRAIAQGKVIDDPRPLVGLLLTPDRLVRAEAALALAHLQVAEGAAAIERLALETDIHVRQRIASGLGEIKNPAFVPTLILMLDDRPEVQRLAVRSLVQIVGSDVGSGDSSKPAPLDQQAERWRRWHAAQQSLSQQG